MSDGNLEFLCCLVTLCDFLGVVRKKTVSFLTGKKENRLSFWQLQKKMKVKNSMPLVTHMFGTQSVKAKVKLWHRGEAVARERGFDSYPDRQIFSKAMTDVVFHNVSAIFPQCCSIRVNAGANNYNA